MMKYLSVPAMTDHMFRKLPKNELKLLFLIEIVRTITCWKLRRKISGLIFGHLHVTHDASWWDGWLPEDRSYLTGNDRGDLPQVRSWSTASEQASPHQALQVPQAGNQVIITQLKISKTIFTNLFDMNGDSASSIFLLETSPTTNSSSLEAGGATRTSSRLPLRCVSFPSNSSTSTTSLPSLKIVGWTRWIMQMRLTSD